MTISDARATLAEVVDQVRIGREPVFLTRRGKPVAALVDLVYLDALQRVQLELEAASENDSAKQRRLDAWIAEAAEFADWVKPGVTHPASASDIYASRMVDL